MTHDEKAAAVHAYIAAFAANDPEAVRQIFSAGARVEDPVGSPAHVGIEAIVEFYTRSMAMKPKLQLEGPIRTAANSAAFAFSVVFEGTDMAVEVIDIFEFDEEGKVSSMRAYFAPENMKGFPQDWSA
ncbi:nuclear transport factor 2 family protein [Croceicoccus sp. F390]|uniref:Nuclear transport factor 2 family protein n=1 Tax=Croceicoccus esteveae TaxID=3075597 RepID=A0ABU2ZFI4_9SPHN|nr:nuclear transport factor 2 family protein [Croceicoccus sp. F390]MDT0575362.1 nuclear transport factor 2 family protein [Croceicoccus sp. F390]